MKPDWKSLLFRGGKYAVTGLVLFFIGKQFYSDFSQLDFDQLQLRPAWLVASAGLYLMGLLPSAWFWQHLHRQFGHPLPLYAAVRAHYIGQLGKYVPGKWLAILMRARLAHPFGVPLGVSIIISFYEVLTGMAAGGIVAAVIYAFEPPGDLGIGLHPLAIGAILIGLCGVPLLPGVFNFVVARLSARIQAVQLYHLPPLRFGILARGLAATGAGWWVQGLSWWALLCAVMPDRPELTFSLWAQCTASIAFATVAGFAMLLPGGIGVREIMLRELLAAALSPAPYISIAAILLRLDWIVTESLFAVCTYWPKPRTLAVPPPHPQPLSPEGARGETPPPHPQPLSPGAARGETPAQPVTPNP